MLDELREEGRLEERWAWRHECWLAGPRGSARRRAVEVISGELWRCRLVEPRFKLWRWVD